MMSFTESVVEDAALAWLKSLGYAVLSGPAIAVGEPGAERSDPNYRNVILENRLQQALVRLNPDLPAGAIEEAFRILTRFDAPSFIARELVATVKKNVTIDWTVRDNVRAQLRVM